MLVFKQRDPPVQRSCRKLQQMSVGPPPKINPSLPILMATAFHLSLLKYLEGVFSEERLAASRWLTNADNKPGILPLKAKGNDNIFTDVALHRVALTIVFCALRFRQGPGCATVLELLSLTRSGIVTKHTIP